MTVLDLPELDLDALLSADDPFAALYEAVRDALAEDVDRDRLLAVLDDARLRFAHLAQERESDVLADVMDCMTGWCAPRMQL